MGYFIIVSVFKTELRICKFERELNTHYELINMACNKEYNKYSELRIGISVSYARMLLLCLLSYQVLVMSSLYPL
jgi:hypothetical protein